MNLTVEQYKEMKAAGMRDPEILQAIGLSPKSTSHFNTWKSKNDLIGLDWSTCFLNREKVAELAKTKSLKAIAEHYGIKPRTFNSWVRKQRKMGFFI